MGRKDGVAVCDPVFLLNKNQWEQNIGKDKFQHPYILVYLSEKSKQIENITKTIAKKTGWNIYTVGAISEKYADKCFINAGPFDFVKLIRDSKFVISNSFHATAFSIIFEKNFCVVNREEGINERMKSVLNDFGLNERLVTKYDDNLLKEIDYSIFKEKVQSIIEFSKEWIVNAIEK